MKPLLILFLFFFTLTCNPLLAQESSSSSSIAKISVFINVSDVPIQSSETLQNISHIKKSLDYPTEILDIYAELPPYIQSVHNELSDPLYDYLLDMDINSINKLSNNLRIHSEYLNTVHSTLDKEIVRLQKIRKKLSTLSSLWAETYLEATKQNAPPSITDLINSVIISIEESKNIEKEHYDALLGNSSTITNMLLNIEKKEDALKDAKDTLLNQFFTRDASWLWSDFDSEYFLVFEYGENIVLHVKEGIHTLNVFYTTHATLVIWLLLLMVLSGAFIYYFYYLYVHRKLFVKRTSFSKKSLFFLRRPISTFIILSVLLNILLFPERPIMVILITQFIIIYPSIRILSMMIDKSLHIYIYQFFLIYTINVLLGFSEGFDLTHRIFTLLNTLYFMALSIHFLLAIKEAKLQLLSNKKILYFLTSTLILFLSFSLLASIIGYTLLSETISNNTISLLAVTLVTYLLTLILQGYILLIFRRRVTTLSTKLRDFSAKMEYSILFFIRIFMFFWWGFFVFKILNLNDEVLMYKAMFLSLTWNIGEMQLSVNSIVNFIIIILFTWFSARSVQIILTFFVFTRIKLGRGIATAISSISNYFIITVGVLAALASLGISTQQFIVIFGALGVGIGFGLRNIIANFVSGIILIFERPVQIGDTITMDDIMGDVTKIGSRSSTIRTFDGSDVIVPNADFISQKIINWTFGDKERRKTFYIKVAMGTKIQEVLDTMMEVAQEHPDVLETPEPIATLLNVGEYFLEFKLYFWLNNNVIVAPSDIAIGVYEGLLEKGIKMPASKQEIVVEQERG